MSPSPSISAAASNGIDTNNIHNYNRPTEEQIHRKNYIVICELHHPQFHGFDSSSDPNVMKHFLVHSKYIANNRVLYDGSLIEDEQENLQNMESYYYREMRRRQTQTPVNHPFIRNYKNIMQSGVLLRPEIAEVVTLSGGESVAIIKTFWLRCIQRAWRRVLKERQRIIQLRCHPDSLYYMQIRGMWPSNCSALPDLHGLMIKN